MCVHREPNPTIVLLGCQEVISFSKDRFDVKHSPAISEVTSLQISCAISFLASGIANIF